MKIYQCMVYWLTHDVLFRFPAKDSQDFVNKLKAGLLDTNKSPDFKLGEVTEY